MSRIPKAVLGEVQASIRTGISLNILSKKHGLGKSTLYYHYKKIKGKKFVTPNVAPEFSETEGEIVGAYAGDGSQHYANKNWNYQINMHFGVHALEYAEYLQQLFHSYFHKTFNLYDEGDGFRLRLCSKDIFYYFKNYLNYDPTLKHVTVRLRSLDLPKDFKVGFLRGLVDTDGSVKFCTDRNKVRVSFQTTSIELHKQCREVLREFNISHGGHCLIREGYKPLHVIQLHQASVIPFLDLVRPFKRKYVESYLNEAAGSNPA